MFTGIIQETGTLLSADRNEAGKLLRIRAIETLSDVSIGDSIAVNGVCLTVIAAENGEFTADVMEETLRVSSLGTLSLGDKVNLERPLRADGRFDGHIVQGHVDGMGEIRSIEAAVNATSVQVTAPLSVLRYCVPKGSITLDGISLTIVDVGRDQFSVSVIPHTWKVTNLAERNVGDSVNLEADVLAKYVERLLGLQKAEQIDAGGGTPV